MTLTPTPPYNGPLSMQARAKQRAEATRRVRHLRSVAVQHMLLGRIAMYEQVKKAERMLRQEYNL